MAHWFVPADADKSFYEQTRDGGYLHAWKMTVAEGETHRIGLWGGYDHGKPLTVTSNNPGKIAFTEPPAAPNAERFVEITGRAKGATMLEAGNGSGPPWCSLQVEVVERLYTPNIPEIKLYAMSYDYFMKVASGEMSEKTFCEKWNVPQREYTGLVVLFRNSPYNRSYWEKTHSDSLSTVATTDFLVIGEGGITTMNSEYGDVILGRRLKGIQPRSGIGSVAGAVARIFTDDPDLIGVIEASGDLIETGASGFMVARNVRAVSTKPKRMPFRTIQQRKIVGDQFRDDVYNEVKRMHEGTGYKVEKEVTFKTELGDRRADVVLRDPRGKIVCVFECKTGKGTVIKEQFRKDSELYYERDIKTIKVTTEFLMLPE